MDKETLRIIIVWETILMIVVSILCGLIIGKTLNKLYKTENEYKNLQNEYNQIITRRK